MNIFQNAHMSVIEALMVLYAKEVASSGRVSAALERYFFSILLISFENI